MIRCLMGLVLSLFCFQNAIASENSLSSMYLGSRECDKGNLPSDVIKIRGGPPGTSLIGPLE